MLYRLQSIYLFFLFTSITLVHAQRIENVRASTVDDKIIVTYDINGASEGQKFKSQLFSSHNNFSSPLIHVAGDVGLGNELLAGNTKRIEWNVKSEITDYTGDVTFEVRAEVIAAPLLLTSPQLSAKFKRGKILNINWKGGMPSENVRLELLKGGSTVSPITQLSNVGNYSWSIPKKTKKGSDYQIKLTSDRQSVVSNNFKIKNRTPFIVKALPVLAAGAVVYLITSGGKKEDNSLPEPPQPN
jgi:hypothetical protein